MAPHKEFQYCIVHLGTHTTKIQFSQMSVLHETLPSKTLFVPSKVYAHATEPTWFASTGTKKIEFIKDGKIINHAAFNYFIKLVLKSAIKHEIDDFENSQIHDENLLNIHLVIVTSSAVSDNFSKIQLQESINYFYENLKRVVSTTIISNALSLLFAYGSNNMNTALVVDIGYNKLSIMPIVDYLTIDFAGLTLPIGGNSINKKLKELIKDLNDQQIEDLKRSDIYEILSEFNKNKTNTDYENDGELDVLEIVTSNKPTEIIDKRSKKKTNAAASEETKTNRELEYNKFIDSNGEEHEVGKQRFLGSEELLSNLHYFIDYAISKYPDFFKRQDLWSNIILNGPVLGITGFEEYLMSVLRKHYLAANLENDEDPETKFRATSNADQGLVYNQTPTNIKFVKRPEYFQDWKDSKNPKGINNDLTILGALVYTKLCFGPGHHSATVNNIGNELYSIKKEDFEELGPNIIWDLNH